MQKQKTKNRNFHEEDATAKQNIENLNKITAIVFDQKGCLCKK